jgi:hypothetical protein
VQPCLVSLETKSLLNFEQDWALFQTSDPKRDNYVSTEYVPNKLRPGQNPATVQSLSTRFDQKGHERPFQKAIIVDIVDGYMNPGDKIIIRLGDKRFGGRGTRCQTFVEDNFLMRWYIDPVGTSRFAAIKPDIAINIVPGKPTKLKVITPRLVWPGAPFPISAHPEDEWGNAVINQEGISATLRIHTTLAPDSVLEKTQRLPNSGWTYAHFLDTILSTPGDYIVIVHLSTHKGKSLQATAQLSVDDICPIPRPLFADLHVHSDDTVGTNSTSYNFSYARLIAGLDIVGYTANDFNITAAKWSSTVSKIISVNAEFSGSFLLFPGTEWCGNSAAGGDHNVVFLDDPSTNPPEFPIDRDGNVARSFEWNEDGPAELLPGAWPLDEVYATYAHSPESNLMIPHVGGRRCNLSWHHPKLERLLEIGSAWGIFEWLLRDAVARGWKMGVCANSDEHRGRCGGGVPGTAVFGTKGGLTGVLAESLERGAVASALRARRTFATTGERLVGLLFTEGAIQGDDLVVPAGNISAKYAVFGEAGFSSVEAWDAKGCFFKRDLWQEEGAKRPTWRKLRITWGGARLYDRYKEAIWKGSITASGEVKVTSIQPFGGILDVPEDVVQKTSDSTVSFETRTSGDFDGVNLLFEDDAVPEKIQISGALEGYVKVGDALKGNPHKAQPHFVLESSWEEALVPGGKSISIAGGADLGITVEVVPDVQLPAKVEGSLSLEGLKGEKRSVYIVGREWNGGKVITSPLFLEYT